MSKLFDPGALKFFQRAMGFLAWLKGVAAASYSYTYFYTPVSAVDWQQIPVCGEAALFNSTEALNRINFFG